jgi:hypothetical protein
MGKGLFLQTPEKMARLRSHYIATHNKKVRKKTRPA